MRGRSNVRLMAGMVTLALCCNELASYIPALAERSGDEYSVDHEIVNSWDGGYQADLTLNNLSDKDMTDWQISFTIPAEITDSWGGMFVLSDSVEYEAENDESSGNPADSENPDGTEKSDDAQAGGSISNMYVVTAGDYNSTIPAGGSITVGYVANGDSGDITDIEVDYTLATDTSNDNDNNEDDEENKSDDSNENIQAEPSGSIYVGSCYTVEVLVPQAWEHAYNAKLIITNTSDETLHNWGFIFKTDDSVTGLYNATELSAHDGTRLFKNAGYNQDIPAGGTVEVGYTAYYGDSFDVPDEFALASFERSVEMPEYRVETFVTDEWDDGAVAEIVIENISDKAIEDWTLEFDSDMDISRVWDGVLISHEGDHYIIRNADYVQNIAAGDRWTVGLEINGSISDIENVIMTEIAVTDEAQSSDETTVSENTVSENTVSENSVSENTVSENNADPDEMDYETDTDGDGIPDAYEEYFGTDKNDPDTDDDGLTDYEEIFIAGTDPTVYDSVTSGVSDYDADIDGDGLSNGAELQAGLDPLNDDTDFDGLKDGEEAEYGTDPLTPDTDGDGINDGDEVKIGLDPTNPATFGVPDSEYVMPQSLGYDSDALSAINDKETAYQLALDAKAVGYIGNIDIKESPYSHVLSNTSVIGMIPAIEYGDKLEEMTIHFKVSDAYTTNELGTYAAVNSELAGIKRLAIGYYSEDLRICLPIETEYNEQTNEVYTTVTNQGTYCLIDMEKWFDMLGFEPDDLAEESSNAGNSCEYIMYYDRGMSTEQCYIMNYGASSDDDSYVDRVVAMMQLGIDKWIYQTNGENQYAFIMNDMTYDEAKSICESLGGHLAKIDNDDEQQFIKRWAGLVETNKRYWFGGFDLDAPNPQDWITGIRISYSDIGYNIAEQWDEYLYFQSGETFLSAYLWGNGTKTEKNYFICEWDPENQTVDPDDVPVMYFNTTFNPVPEDFGPVTMDNVSDYDGDGLKNNQEIDFSFGNTSEFGCTVSLSEMYSYYETEVGKKAYWNKSDEGKAIIKMDDIYLVLINSDPTMVDSDGDGIYDGIHDGGQVDLNPLHNDRFHYKIVEMINQGIIIQSEMMQTDDGFAICLTSVADILKEYGYQEYSLVDFIREGEGLSYYFDCWYLFSISNDDGASLGMIKMCCEDKGRVPKIGIPFINVEDDIFDSFSYNNAGRVNDELVRVSKCTGDNDPDKIILDYFCDERSEGLYLIPELYVNLVWMKEVDNGQLDINHNGTQYKLCEYSEDVLDKNKVGNGTTNIYDEENGKLIIDNYPMTIEQKQCILAVRTNNPSFNSVAAEIVYHARYTRITRDLRNNGGFINPVSTVTGVVANKIYSSAIKADLSVDDTGKPEKSYKSDNGEFVKAQIRIWGKY